MDDHGIAPTCRARPLKYAATLVGICLVAFLPGSMSIPPVDRDEPRYAQATRELLSSRDHIIITFQGRLFSHKPIGIHWLQALSAVLVGEPFDNPIWAYRVPSIVGALLAVLATFAAGRFIFDTGAAFLAAALLGVSVLLVVEARLATTDAALLLCIVIAQASVARVYLQQSPRPPAMRWALGFWAAVGFGILLKGPVIVAVCGLTIITLVVTDHTARWLRPLTSGVGIGLTLLIVLPWMIAIGLMTSGRFFVEAIRDDMLPTLARGFEGHGAPPGYHAALFPFMFWPGSILALAALPWIWRHRRDARVRFCLAWILPTWLMFELMPTKLPHYVLSTYPGIALLAGWAAAEMPAPFASLGGTLAVAIWTMVTVFISLGVALFSVAIGGPLDPVAVATALAIALFAVVVVRFVAYGERRPIVVIGALLLYVPIFGHVLPGVESWWLGWKAARTVRGYAAHLGIREPIVAAAGFREPSLVFLLGRATILTNGQGAAEHIIRNRSGFALVDLAHRETFHIRLREAGIVARLLDRVEGVNYSSGRRQELAVYIGADDPVQRSDTATGTLSAPTPGRRR